MAIATPPCSDEVSGFHTESCTERYTSHFKNNCLAEMWSGSVVFKAHTSLCHSTLESNKEEKKGRTQELGALGGHGDTALF